ncbi:MAG: hypothetical protein PUP90_04395 [Nostoc sp. S4]|nr:hypothetical protein [Nostoc sp. S4]
MNILRVLAVVGIPLVIGTFGFVAPQANAESPFNPRPQISQQRPRPENELQKPHKKPQIKHQQRHQQPKKHPPKPQNQGAVPNRIPHNNRQ